MVIRLRTAFFIALGIIIVWFLYIERAILAPFILAAIFSYIFNPVISFLSLKAKIPRTISILLLWAAIIGILSTSGTFIVRQVIEESAGLAEFLKEWSVLAKDQVNTLPDFIKPTLNEALSSLQRTALTTSFSLFTFFPQAISGVIGFFIFLVSSFYFLKEGKNIPEKFLTLIPNEYRLQAEILLRRINMVLGNYLRGQLLVILTSFLLFFTFYSILGVRFALVLALISGILEIVIIIGPFVAGAIAVFIFLLTGVSNFNLSLFQGVLAIIVGNFVIRQFQDLIINPNIMGRAVKLHPLIVLFAVLSGGHLAGILGLILAVPIAAVIKVIFEFLLDKINGKSRPASIKNT